MLCLRRWQSTNVYFSDVRLLQKKAKAKQATVEEIVQRAWVNKHRLPPTHPLWVEQPFASHLLEYFRDQWTEKERMEEQLKNPDISPDIRDNLIKAIRAIEDILDDGTMSEGKWRLTTDPVSDWLEYKEDVLDKELDDEDLELTPEEARELLRQHGY